MTYVIHESVLNQYMYEFWAASKSGSLYGGFRANAARMHHFFRFQKVNIDEISKKNFSQRTRQQNFPPFGVSLAPLGLTTIVPQISPNPTFSPNSLILVLFVPIVATKVVHKQLSVIFSQTPRSSNQYSSKIGCLSRAVWWLWRFACGKARSKF